MKAESNILNRIVADKLREVAAAKSACRKGNSAPAVQRPPVRDFFAALDGQGTIRLIAEVKKAAFQASSAPISVLSRSPALTRARGALHQRAHRRAVLPRQPRLSPADPAAVGVPVLRKDFIIDPYQVIEARAAGADAVLLIAECLDDRQLQKLHDAIVALGMTPLVELYEPANLRRVLAIGARLIGINNRDLRTFEVDLKHTVRVRREVPAGQRFWVRAAFDTRADVELLERAGVDAMLVGETLMARGISVKRWMNFSISNRQCYSSLTDHTNERTLK